jgi:hypothetical protein
VLILVSPLAGLLDDEVDDVDVGDGVVDTTVASATGNPSTPDITVTVRNGSILEGL